MTRLLAAELHDDCKSLLANLLPSVSPSSLSRRRLFRHSAPNSIAHLSSCTLVMRSHVLLLSCLLAVAVTADEEVKKEENVWVLTTDNFDSVIKDNKYVLAEFCKYDHPYPLHL